MIKLKIIFTTDAFLFDLAWMRHPWLHSWLSFFLFPCISFHPLRWTQRADFLWAPKCWPNYCHTRPCCKNLLLGPEKALFSTIVTTTTHHHPPYQSLMFRPTKIRFEFVVGTQIFTPKPALPGPNPNPTPTPTTTQPIVLLKCGSANPPC